MAIEFDPRKDGISLARAGDIQVLARVEDERRTYGERRLRAFGLIDGLSYCLAYTLRGETIRAISLRRALAKEMKRHGL